MTPLVTVLVLLALVSCVLVARRRRVPSAPALPWSVLSLPGTPVSVLAGASLVEGVVEGDLDDASVQVALASGGSLPVARDALLPSLLSPPVLPAPPVARLPLPAPRFERDSVLYGGRLEHGALVLGEVDPSDVYRVTVVTLRSRRRSALAASSLSRPFGGVQAVLRGRRRVVTVYSRGRFVGQRSASSALHALDAARDVVASDLRPRR